MQDEINQIVQKCIDEVFEKGDKTFYQDGKVLKERIEEMAKAKGYPAELTDMLVWAAQDSYYAGHKLLQAYLYTLVNDLTPKLSKEIQKQVLKNLPKSQ